MPPHYLLIQPIQSKTILLTLHFLGRCVGVLAAVLEYIRSWVSDKLGNPVLLDAEGLQADSYRQYALSIHNDDQNIVIHRDGDDDLRRILIPLSHLQARSIIPLLQEHRVGLPRTHGHRGKLIGSLYKIASVEVTGAEDVEEADFCINFS